MNIISSIHQKFSGENNPDSIVDTSMNDVKIETTFKLPIDYLESKDIKHIPESVSNDLELLNINENGCQSVYDVTMLPKNCFAKQLLPMWNHSYTTNIYFLKDTQQIIQRIELHKKNLSIVDKNFNIEHILPIWKNTKQNSFFHEKYKLIIFFVFSLTEKFFLLSFNAFFPNLFIFFFIFNFKLIF